MTLKVNKQDVEGHTEYSFNLTHANPSTKKADGASLPHSESSRRNTAQNLKCVARLYINERRVAETKKVAVKWPSFEAEICELFQVHVFTMPSSIFVELVVYDGISTLDVDRIDLEVPGQHVKTLTCASSLIQTLPFSRLAYKRREVQDRYAFQSKKPEGILTEAQRKKMEAEQKDREAKEKKLIDGDVNGDIFVKCEWKGNGPHMPPIKHENLFKKPKVAKNRREATQEEETLMLLKQLYLDVNDPRNENVIRLLRETKNEFLIKLLTDDSKNNLADLEPFRHKLLQARLKDPLFSHVFIPMLESEIIDSTRTGFYLA